MRRNRKQGRSGVECPCVWLRWMSTKPRLHLNASEASAVRFRHTGGERWAVPGRGHRARVVDGRQEDQLSTRRSLLLVFRLRESQHTAMSSFGYVVVWECNNQGAQAITGLSYGFGSDMRNQDTRAIRTRGHADVKSGMRGQLFELFCGRHWMIIVRSL